MSNNFPGRFSQQGGNDGGIAQASCEVVQWDNRCTNYPQTGQSFSLGSQFNFRCRPYNYFNVSDIRLKTNISYL